MKQLTGLKVILLSGIFLSLALAGCAGEESNSLDPLGVDVSDESAKEVTLIPRMIPDKPEHTTLDPAEFNGVVVVKFVEGADIRLREGKLVSLSTGLIDALEQIFSQYNLASIERQFTQPEDELAKDIAELEAETGEDLADLNLYFVLSLADKADGESLIDALNALDIVELAGATPSPAPPPS